ncbi:MAG: hypothetical protein MHM6MM_005115 [Cercozoa sp. M6MM]
MYQAEDKRTAVRLAQLQKAKEKALLEQDARSEAIRKAEQEAIVERARRFVFETDDRYKQFQSAKLVSDVIWERGHQGATKIQNRLAEIAEDAKFTKKIIADDKAFHEEQKQKKEEHFEEVKRTRALFQSQVDEREQRRKKAREERRLVRVSTLDTSGVLVWAYRKEKE